MCECGCGDFNASWRLPGPKGTTYSIQVYPGCDFCDTPAGILIGKHSKEDAAAWGVPDLPEPTFPKLNDKDYDGAQFAIPVFHPQELVRAMSKRLEPALLRSVDDDDAEDEIPDEDELREMIGANQDKVRREMGQ